MIHEKRFTTTACLAVLFVAGCGTSPTPKSDSTPTGKQIVTFYVNQMSDRLKLD